MNNLLRALERTVSIWPLNVSPSSSMSPKYLNSFIGRVPTLIRRKPRERMYVFWHRGVSGNVIVASVHRNRYHIIHSRGLLASTGCTSSPDPVWSLWCGWTDSTPGTDTHVGASYKSQLYSDSSSKWEVWSIQTLSSNSLSAWHDDAHVSCSYLEVLSVQSHQSDQTALVPNNLWMPASNEDQWHRIGFCERRQWWHCQKHGKVRKPTSTPFTCTCAHLSVVSFSRTVIRQSLCLLVQTCDHRPRWVSEQLKCRHSRWDVVLCAHHHRM